MALVAYDNSDSSEFEDYEDEKSFTTSSKIEEPSISKLPAKAPAVTISEDVEDHSHSDSLFNFLPQPTKKGIAVVEEDDEFLHKKETVSQVVKTKARITVPSLSDFKDVEDRPNMKPKVPSEKKSGLLSMLPQPRNGVTVSTKSLIPHVLTKKPATVTKKPLPPIKTTPKVLVNNYSDDSDNDDEVQNDFFSINKPVDIPIDDTPFDEQPTIAKNVPNNISAQKRNIQSYFKQDEVQSQVELEPDSESSNNSTGSYTTQMAGTTYSNGYGIPENSNSNVLDEEAILKLCGTRGKRKREDIQIVDVNQQEVLADAREWLLKGLMDDTSKRVSSSKRKGNEPTSQQRRKHQITYLAHQAKANEAELQNQWANNRVTKRQTQSKYGF